MDAGGRAASGTAAENEAQEGSAKAERMNMDVRPGVLAKQDTAARTATGVASA